MAHNAYLLANAAPVAARRMAALAELFDDATMRYAAALGLRSGWRCWLAGAGGPALPRRIAAAVGATGRVLATDIDTTWLDDEAVAGVAVVRHDVVDDAPPGEFDLVHARLVLTHLPQRDRALEHLAHAVRPGGWLLVEDFDVALQPRAVLEPTTDGDRAANRIRAGFVALLAGRGVDLRLGRTLPSRVRALGLSDVGAESRAPLAHPALATLEAANVEQVGPGLVAAGYASDADIAAHLERLGTGELELTTPPIVSAWGRRPA